MASNPYVNKVQKADGTVLIDLSEDTVSSASDIVSGKIGHLNDGSQVTGTAETGGGYVTQDANGYIVLPPTGNAPVYWNLVAVDSVVANNYTSTSATTVKTLTLNITWNDSPMVFVFIRKANGKEAGTWFGTDGYYVPTSTASSISQNHRVYYVSSNGTVGSLTGNYGVFATYLAKSTATTATLPIQMCYNSSTGATINGTYNISVYTLTCPSGITHPFGT